MGTKKLTSFHLKLLAIISMLIDHIAAALIIQDSPIYMPMRIIGRLSFILFAFLIVEGFYHTSNIKRYLVRLLIFAFISEIPFDLAFYGVIFDFSHQNIFFTLFFALLLLEILRKIELVYIHNKMITTFYSSLSILGISLIVTFLNTDYTFIGIFIILGFYYFRNKHISASVYIFVLQYITVNLTQAFGTLSMIPISMYNGQKGRDMKYVFYLFYPVHLLLLYIIQIYK